MISGDLLQLSRQQAALDPKLQVATGRSRPKANGQAALRKPAASFDEKATQLTAFSYIKLRLGASKFSSTSNIIVRAKCKVSLEDCLSFSLALNVLG